jgi:hypothetical protein
MRYEFVQKLIRVFNERRVAYHLACAYAAAREEGDKREGAILALMTNEERQRAREARQ